MYRREVPVPVTITVLHERREAPYYAVACLRALRAVQWGACVLLCVWWCVKRVQRREREEPQDVRWQWEGCAQCAIQDNTPLLSLGRIQLSVESSDS